MDKDKRENEIYELREQGLTYSHIASIFDISRSRAHQIFRIAKYKRDTIETLPPLKRKLSKRTQKALVKHFGSESILEDLKLSRKNFRCQEDTLKPLEIFNLLMKNDKNGCRLPLQIHHKIR